MAEDTRVSPKPGGVGRIVGQIVVAADATDASREGVRLAAVIARATGAHVTVVHVRHIPTMAADTAAMPEIETSMDELEVATRANADSDLAGIDWTFEVATGHVGSAVIDSAAAAAADLVVVGSVKHGALHNALLGSTTVYLVEHSPFPVLVARHG